MMKCTYWEILVPIFTSLYLRVSLKINAGLVSGGGEEKEKRGKRQRERESERVNSVKEKDGLVVGKTGRWHMDTQLR